MGSQRDGSARSTKAPGRTTSRSSSSAPVRSKAERRRAASNALAAARGGRSAHRRWWTVLGPVTLVLVLIAVLVIVKVASGPSSPKSGAAAGLAPAALVSQLGSVPAATLNAVGAGTAGAKPFTSLPTPVNGAPLTNGGLPRVLFVGADYCPYCAAERWALVVALSRFGGFDNLGTTTSSPSDRYPNTQTLSFHGTRYTSPELAFTGYEMYSNQAHGSRYAPLDTLSAADEALFARSGGSFPYINIGGKYVISGASYDPQLLAGMSRAQIAAGLTHPDSRLAQAIDGTANVITAAVCKVIGGSPKSVCTAPGVVTAAAKLNG